MVDTKAFSHVMNTYGRLPVEFDSGKGVWLIDTDGNRYMDLISGLGVVSLGHADPGIASVVADQMNKLVHTSNLFYTRPMGELAAKLSSISLGGKVFFSNSGAESVEAALKLAKKHGSTNMDGASRIVALDGSFHGRTLGALSATGQPDKWAGFEPLLPNVTHVPINDHASFDAAFGPDVCGVIVEVIQGEGGVIPSSPEWLAHLRKACDSTGALLIFDEVQTGIGRTGKWFAYQNHEVTPDAITVAKALANGLPIGALVATPGHSDILGPGTHASTFGGGPVVCSAALEVLNRIESEGLLARVAEASARFIQGLDRVAGASGGSVVGVRGKGLMLAVELSQDIAPKVAQKCFDDFLLVNAVRPDAIRILPPLVISDNEIDKAVETLAGAIDVVRKGE